MKCNFCRWVPSLSINGKVVAWICHTCGDNATTQRKEGDEQ